MIIQTLVQLSFVQLLEVPRLQAVDLPQELLLQIAPLLLQPLQLVQERPPLIGVLSGGSTSLSLCPRLPLSPPQLLPPPLVSPLQAPPLLWRSLLLERPLLLLWLLLSIPLLLLLLISCCASLVRLRRVWNTTGSR